MCSELNVYIVVDCTWTLVCCKLYMDSGVLLTLHGLWCFVWFTWILVCCRLYTDFGLL